MKTGLALVRDNAKKVVGTLQALFVPDVLVGIPAETGQRKDTTEPSNAMIGFINEFGAPEMNIPARPHLIPGIRDAKEKITSYLGQAGKYALAGDAAGMSRALHAAGMTAQNSVQRRIQTGPFEPLAPATLSARRSRGRTGEKPLLDTGQYRNAIKYVIRSNGKGSK